MFPAGKVTIGATGLQTEIIEKIVDQQAIACIAVKKNQPKLHAAIEQHFGVNCAQPWTAAW